MFGVRQKRTFEEAAGKYVTVNKHKQSINQDIQELSRLHAYFAGQPLEAIHMGSLQRYIDDRKKENVKNRTINYGLQVIRHLLNQAAGEWLDENGTPWLDRPPKIKLLPEHDKRAPRPISWEEQERLFAELPHLLRKMALFAVNTGCRDQEICQLQWDWEIKIPELGSSVFKLPGYYENDAGQLVKFTKNGDSRLVILNRIAGEVIEQQRDQHDRFVFAHQYRGHWRTFYAMNTNGWKAARVRTGLQGVRVHDLRHSFGRRLRAAGVSYEDRQDLLGHKSNRMTTHYSAAEIKNLVDAANRLCQTQTSSPTLMLIQGGDSRSRKSPAGEFCGNLKIAGKS
ncbi:MAG: hypothetical protein A3F10_05800 [Coxiella sp. RIFCSPHIGHO2_12_FULL_42_15]|nr:MAG: hypothetical protein A3F10_05800 [Coxiella sp. RIFCSPHIGHO2_12_FULL_42_15]